MGQYHILCNLTKKEFVHPYSLGVGLKMWEQVCSFPSTGDALILLVSCPERRGGGDIANDNNSEVAGRWHGDRVAMIGDYAQANDIKGVDAAAIASLFGGEASRIDGWTNISDKVAAVMENIHQGRFEGSGWKEFKPNVPGQFITTACDCHRREQEAEVAKKASGMTDADIAEEALLDRLEGKG